MKSVLSCTLLALIVSHSWGQAWQVSQPIPWGVQATHMMLLPSGHLLIWDNGKSPNPGASYSPNATLFKVPAGSDWTDLPSDPNATNYSQFVEPVPLIIPGVHTNLFCAGHIVLDDAAGTVLAVGGDYYHYRGSKRQFIFQEGSPSTWTRLPDLKSGRWYPEVTMTPEGEILTTMGSSDIEDPGRLPEETPTRSYERLAFDPATLANPTALDVVTSNVPFQRRRWFYNEAQPQHFYYPAIYALEETILWAAGSRYDSRKFDLMSNEFDFNRFPHEPQESYQVHSVYPSTCMFIYGNKQVVLKGGGSFTLTNAVRAVSGIDLSSPNPQWVDVPDMAAQRKNHFFLALPNGKMLAVGGNVQGLTAYPADDLLQRTPELLTPDINDNLLNGTWSPVTPISIPRPYHSTVALLPDGRIMVAGGEPTQEEAHPQLNAELITPDYVQGVRPEIASAPDVAFHDEAVTARVNHESGRTVRRLVWITLSSATHSRQFGQRFIAPTEIARTNIDSVTTDITVQTPSNVMATPGWYMLFAEDSAGKVSVAKMMRITSRWTRNLPKSLNISNSSEFSGTASDVTQVDACIGERAKRQGEAKIAVKDTRQVQITMMTKLPASALNTERLKMRLVSTFMGDHIKLTALQLVDSAGGLVPVHVKERPPFLTGGGSGHERFGGEIESNLGGTFAAYTGGTGEVGLKLTFVITNGTLYVDEMRLLGWQAYAP